MKFSELFSQTSFSKRHDQPLPFLNERHLFANAPLTYKVLAAVAGLVIVTASLTALVRLNSALLVEVPTQGGTLHEGIVGTPRYINPVLAVSSADKTLTELVYAGLLTETPEGKLIPELASNYTISNDGLIYTFTLRDNIYFHDGMPITAADVAFTVRRAQDPAVNSPRQGNWADVEVEIIDNKEVRFTLDEAYAPFIYNATLGILPKHIWENTSAEQFAFSTYNIKAVGSGPYRVEEIRRAAGVPKTFHMRPADQYPLGTPYITDVIIHTYSSEETLAEALNNNEVDSAAGISPKRLEQLTIKHQNIRSAPLSRVFHVYFNQNKADLFTDKSVRRALGIVTDRTELVDAVFAGHATPVAGPLPPEVPVEVSYATSSDTAAAATSTRTKADTARTILDDAGWRIPTATNTTSSIRTNDEDIPLSFSLSTSNNPELKQAAEHLKRQWEAIGVGVELKFYDSADLKQSVIRPREFQTLLFGSVIDNSFDIYPLWHSSQRTDPGLNVAQYTNIDVDALLEKARATSSTDIRNEAIRDAAQTIYEDAPAVFLYSPHFIYLTPPDIHNIRLMNLTEGHDRFINVHTWYIETRDVWRPFAGNHTSL